VYRDFFMFQLLTRRLSRTGKLSLKLDTSNNPAVGALI